MNEVCEKAFKPKDPQKRFAFHVNFIWTKEIRVEEHRREVKRSFVNIIKDAIPDLTFDPQRIEPYVIENHGEYLPGRSPEKSPLVLIPKNSEIFKRINKSCADQLNALNHQWGTRYEIQEEIRPGNYTPHATVINRSALNELKAIGISKESLIEELNKRPLEGILTIKSHGYKV